MSFFGIFLILVGLILLAIGIVLLVIHRHEERQWWMWALLVGGVILLVIGLAIWIFGRYQTTLESTPAVTTSRTVHVEHTVE